MFQSGGKPNTWGTVPRWFAQDTPEATPGPGRYDLSRQSLFRPSEERERSLSRGVRREKALPAVAVAQPKARARVRRLRLKKSLLESGEERDVRCEERPLSSFGVGREARDAWGRGVSSETPGPGSYRGHVAGTFEEIEHVFEDQREYTESMYLNSVRKRLRRIGEMQRRHDKAGLDVTEKILFKQETKPRTLRRLTTKRIALEQQINERVKDRDYRMRPRTSTVLPMDGKIGRAPMTAPTLSNLSSISQDTRSTRANFEAQLGGLLSNYAFGTKPNPLVREMNRCRSAGMLPEGRGGSPLPTRGRPRRQLGLAPEDRAPDDEEHDEPSDPIVPLPSMHTIPDRSMRPPSFWATSQTVFKGQRRPSERSSMQPTERSRTPQTIRFQEDPPGAHTHGLRRLDTGAQTRDSDGGSDEDTCMDDDDTNTMLGLLY